MPPQSPLTRESILQAAVRLADEEGIEAVTMRRLASALGVKAMSLYNHIANKGDLVDSMVEMVVEKIDLPTGVEPWDEAIRRCAVSAHAVFRQHVWACSLVMSPSSSGAPQMSRVQYIDWILGSLRAGGFSAELAYRAYHAIDAHILGFTMWQLGHAAGLDAATEGRDLESLATDFIEEMGADFPHLAEHARQHLASPPGEGEREFSFGLELILEGLERARAAG